MAILLVHLRTVLTQEARIDASSLLGAPSYFEGLVADGFTTNSVKVFFRAVTCGYVVMVVIVDLSQGREAIEWVCKKINTEMLDFAAGAQSFVAGMGLGQGLPTSS